MWSHRSQQSFFVLKFNAMVSFFCLPPSSDSCSTWSHHLFFSPVFRDQPALVRYFPLYFSSRTVKHVTELLGHTPEWFLPVQDVRTHFQHSVQHVSAAFFITFFPIFKNDLPITFAKGLNILKPPPLCLTPRNMGMEPPFCIWRYKWRSPCRNFIFF